MTTSQELLQRLDEAGITLPTSVPGRAAAFVPAVRSGQIVFVSGHTSTSAGGGRGAVDRVAAVVEAQAGARLAAAKCLAAAATQLNEGEALARVLRLTVFVASSAGFGGQPTVADAASALVSQVLGAASGGHVRSAIGVAELPGGASVEVEMIAEVANSG